MHRRGIVAAIWLLVGLILLQGTEPIERVFADQAPFWESPTGLVPGNPDIQVRMDAETVDVQVVERGDAIHALVHASFSMVNDGSEATITVGFPASSTSLFDHLASPDAEGYRHADAPGLFSPQAIRAFEVSVDGHVLRSWRQEVPAAADAGFGADWLMWEMAFPAGQSTVVDVQYEQVLTERATDRYVQPMYVLRTGALWHGSIGAATVTLRANGGGALIGGPELYMRVGADGAVETYPDADQIYGPSDAAESSPTQIVWRFTDLEPTRDVGATYVRSSAWRAYSEADRAILTGGSSDPAQLRAAAAAALDILGGPAACGSDSEERLCLDGPHRVPRELVERLAQPARERARRALQLAPDDPAAVLTYGDLEYWFAMPKERHHGELGCWPSNAADAYESAATAGLPGALPRLAGLRASAGYVRFWGSQQIDTCSGEPDHRLDVELVKATVTQGNDAWSRAIARGGDAAAYPSYFGGRWLDDLTAEVSDLRRNRQYREARLQSLEFVDVSVHDQSSATAETVETWEDQTYADGGTIVRDASGRLRQRYDLRKLDGLWKIVDAVIVRG